MSTEDITMGESYLVSQYNVDLSYSYGIMLRIFSIDAYQFVCNTKGNVKYE